MLRGEREPSLDDPDTIDGSDTLEPCSELSHANPSSSSSSLFRLLKLT
jgi:hypothetical protein